MKKMDESVVYFPPDSAFPFWCISNVSDFPHLYLDLAYKHLCFPLRKRYKQKEKYKIGRFVIVSVLTKISSINCFSTVFVETVKKQVDILDRKQCSNIHCSLLFAWENAILRNKGRLAGLHEENCEEHNRKNSLQKSNVPRSQNDYITQVSDKIEGTGT